ncbi:MAG: O-antigen ligase family protein [Pyrinomonadaceae bacterium]
MLQPALTHGPLARLGQRTAFVGLLLYSAIAPHSIAGAEISIAIATVGWIVRTMGSGSTGLHRSRIDIAVVLFLVWTAASSVLSAEPRISLLKLLPCWVVLVFYLTRATATRTFAAVLIVTLVVSSTVGTIYSIFDLVRGRGVVIESINAGSPLQQFAIGPGDTVWRINSHRVYSTNDIDQELGKTAANGTFTVSIISRGEHVERTGVITAAVKSSGIVGNSRNHHFRASGFTRHYETFSELLQMVAQLAFGLALAHLRNHGTNRLVKIALAATLLLTVGIALTAMRTVLVAFVLAAFLMAWRSAHGGVKLLVIFALIAVLGFGMVVIWKTRASSALSLADPSSSLRTRVAQIGLSRVMLHPFFGHGMDAMKKHWNEWGFPGQDMIHLHSTPLQLAFDRGLPALLIWVWIMFLLWTTIAAAEKSFSQRADTNAYGMLLGILGGLTGFLASSLVNYNYGDGEVALLFWFLMGTAVVISSKTESRRI